MAETATVVIDGTSYELPIITGTEGERAIDISKLRATTGLITLDDGYGNTGSCQSAITFIDGELGILRYRGIPIEDLAERSSFMETAELLIFGSCPMKRNETSSVACSPRMLHFTVTCANTSTASRPTPTRWRSCRRWSTPSRHTRCTTSR